jgi:uncharacterized membrane protein
MNADTLLHAFDHAPINLNDTERWLSAGAGLAAVIGGARTGGLRGAGMGILGAGLLYRAASGYCSLYHALGISTADSDRPGVPAQSGNRVCRNIELDAPVGEVFAFWRNLENLPRFMRHLESVEQKDGVRSSWQAKGPLGLSATWDAEIINERPNELIAWQSVPGSPVDTAGSVYFEAMGDRRTRVRVALKYSPPGGAAGIAMADLLGENAEQMIEHDLRQLQQLLRSRGEHAQKAASTTAAERNDRR